jgi:uncharacterized protein (DUF1499 family)
MRNIDSSSEDLYFHENISAKIDRDKHVIHIDIGEKRGTYQTFSFADDLSVNLDQNNNLASLVFRNFRYTDKEETLSVQQRNTVTIRSFLGNMFKRARTLF